MLRKACVITWIFCLFSFVHADLPLNQMSRLSTVALERGKAELIFTVRLFPKRNFDEPKVWTVNSDSIVLVKFPKTYVDPQVRDFGLANDWIESVRAHQFDSETVNLRIALKSGFAVNKDQIRSEVAGENVILYMPLPVRIGNTTNPSSEVGTTEYVNSVQTKEASKKVESASNANQAQENSEAGDSKAEDGQTDENKKPFENVEWTEDETVKPYIEPKLSLTDSKSSEGTISIQNSEFADQNAYRSFSIAKFVALALGLSGLLLVAFGAFKKIKKSALGSVQPRVISRCSLGLKKYLAVIEFEGVRYLIAVGPHDTTLLARLDDKSEPQKFETILVNQTRANANLSTLEQIKSKVAMLSPLDKQ